MRADEQEREPGELSEGTADQVFLALRLAAIDQLQRERIARGEVPLPVVLDDILITFDDRRVIATLRILTKLARNWQVIVFTHHDHLAEIIHSAHPPLPGSVHISRLPQVTIPSGVREADQIRASIAHRGDDHVATDSTEHPPLLAPPSRPVHGRTPPAAADYDPGEVRSWARAHGYDVGDRGRISATIVDAFLHAHGSYR